MTIGLNTSVVLLPKVPMRKRVWDNRIGYFTNRYTIFSDDQTKTDREQFISRFRLEPKDKKAYARVSFQSLSNLLYSILIQPHQRSGFHT